MWSSQLLRCTLWSLRAISSPQPDQSHLHSHCLSLRQRPCPNLWDWIPWVLRSHPTPSALSQVSFPLFTESCGFHVTRLFASDSCRTCPMCCFLGKKTTCFSWFTAQQEALVWLQGITFCCLLFSVLRMSLFGTLWSENTWNSVGFMSVPISFCQWNEHVCSP